MRFKILAFLLLVLAYKSLAQRNYTGKYNDHFGHELRLNSDSTFKHTTRIDLIYSWTSGIWEFNNDTIYLKPVFIYDTLTFVNKEKVIIDSLVLSFDEKGEKINSDQYATLTREYGGIKQNQFIIPEKVYYKEDRLYLIGKNGRLIKKKSKPFKTRNKHISWYIKKN
ncbi:hypothetical protein [Adhaeribacter terreus]|uniref:Uncharacterized protein n=1 Tax=Adhaeribacter terreus TaxID=529703 RepID=A0ABW0EF14_9BACT